MEVQVSEAQTGPLAVIRWQQADETRRQALLSRGVAAIFASDLQEQIRALVHDVAANGDDAVVRALERFDKCKITRDQLRISQAELQAAGRSVPSELQAAARTAIANLRTFNEQATHEREWQQEIRPGLVVGERLTAVASAGLFIPSGKGSFPSVLAQLAVPAIVAGVPEIAVVVPPMPGGGGEVDPAVLWIALELGLTNVFRANGPAGIAALAFGTDTFPRVRKIVGPGSPPVQAAQIICQQYGCHTQMLCGPSESLIIADESVDVTLLAADLLNEAEHGPDSSSVLVTHSERLLDRVQEKLAARLRQLPEPRRGYAELALGTNGGCVLTENLLESSEVANIYAPEHMQIAVAPEHEAAVLERVRHAGEVLLGQNTPISAANYVIGVPAALPTGAFARVTSGITAETFLKHISVAKATAEALADLSADVLAFADHEGFPAHAAAVRARQSDDHRREDEA
jgi:histidinol dehydrogenase